MTHEECQDRLLELAYGELDRRLAGETEAHVATCPVCAGVYRRIAGVRDVMGRLEPERPPGSGERLVLAAAREAAQRRRERRPALGLPPWAWKVSAVAALVAAVAGVSVKIASMREQSTTEELARPAGAGDVAERKPEATPLAGRAAAPVKAEAPAARAGPRPSGLAAREPSRPAPASSAAAPARGIAIEQKRAAGPSRPEAAPEPALRREAPPGLAAAPLAAPRSKAAGAEAPRPSSALSDAESEAPPGSPGSAGPAPAPAAPSPAAAPLAAAGEKDRAGIGAARTVARDVEAQIGRGKLSESARPFQACGPAEDADRRLYRDADGRVLKYVRQTGSAEAALTIEQYYDRQGRLRHVYVHGGAVNGAVLEHRIWLDAEGRRLLEQQRFRRGRYPFPETWPESELSLEAPDDSVLQCGAP